MDPEQHGHEPSHHGRHRAVPSFGAVLAWTNPMPCRVVAFVTAGTVLLLAGLSRGCVVVDSVPPIRRVG